MFIVDLIVWVHRLFCKHEYKDRIRVTLYEPPREYKECIKCFKEIH